MEDKVIDQERTGLAGENEYLQAWTGPGRHWKVGLPLLNPLLFFEPTGAFDHYCSPPLFVEIIAIVIKASRDL